MKTFILTLADYLVDQIEQFGRGRHMTLPQTLRRALMLGFLTMKGGEPTDPSEVDEIPDHAFAEET